MNMNITLDNNLDESLHMQIVAAIKKQIASSELRPKEALPSAHTLARALHISLHTIKKAYAQLEEENLIYTLDDEVSFVTDHTQDTYQKDELMRIKESLKQVASLAKTYNISIEQLHNLLDGYYMKN